MREFWRWGKKISLGVILGVFLIVFWTERSFPFCTGSIRREIEKTGSTDSKMLAVKSNRTVALTFDDGPHEKWTPLLLDGLEERGVKVTFFLMGENIAGNEEIVRRMSKAGHLIGNHSFRHVQLTKEGMEEVCNAFEKTGDLIEKLTGSRPQYVRPPYGDWNEELECRTNLTTVLWDVDTLDT